ncbi:hypothetical protein DSCW_32710 [Desulfosarcina widdelii]|uniref:Uncharacterized protein n=2 Tax=Desulfosarcina widdelii TaxID=947919 RepID=A0A5K7ZBP1_9BACT|nr:hypothetical protein DSCW_32710 [Desulfosarcina widdelii]
MPQNRLTPFIRQLLEQDLAEKLEGDPLDSPAGYWAKTAAGKKLKGEIKAWVVWSQDTFKKRSTDSLNWIRNDKSVMANLKHKSTRHLLTILEYLICSALGFSASQSASYNHGTPTTKMLVTKTNKDGKKKKEFQKRVPVLVYAPPEQIAKHCDISPRLAERYVKALVDSGLVLRAKKAKVKQPGGAPLIIGGFVRYTNKDGNFNHRPVYFWSPSHKTKVKPLLHQFTVYPR